MSEYEFVPEGNFSDGISIVLGQLPNPKTVFCIITEDASRKYN